MEGVADSSFQAWNVILHVSCYGLVSTLPCKSRVPPIWLRFYWLRAMCMKVAILPGTSLGAHAMLGLPVRRNS